MVKEDIRQAQQRFWCVENFSMADVLSVEERDELHTFMRFDSYKKGETIYFPGDPDDTVYSIHHGCVRLAYLDENGRRLTLAIMGPGQVFGESSMTGAVTQRWIAEATEDSVVCRISKLDLLPFAERNSKLALKISKLVGERMVAIENKLETLLFKGVPIRLARTLLHLAERFGDQETAGMRIDIKLTQQELGHLIGATRETTSVALSELERRGLISKGHGRILLKDVEGLKQIS